MLVDPRLVLAFGAVLVSGLLLLQYAHRRRAFILPWAAGWLLIAPAMLLTAAADSLVVLQRNAAGLSQLLSIFTAALFFWSGDLFRSSRLVRQAHLRWLAALVVWFLLGPLAFGPAAAVVPGHICTAAILAAAGAVYTAVLLERRMIGAGLAAFVLVGLAIADLTTATMALRGTAGYSLQLLVLRLVLYACGALGVHLLVFEDMTYELRATNRRLAAAQNELMRAAVTDPLTGCHNRRFFDQVIGRELQRHERFGLPLSLLFIDVDRFKTINDTMGHEAGDEVLRYVAQFLKQRIREADYIFRWGGDEFLVLITCTAAEARRKAALLQAGFDTAPEAVDLPPGLGLSVGCIEVPPGTADLMPLVREADKRMYEDKGRR